MKSDEIVKSQRLKIHELSEGRRLYSSYHCSRYNTNTKRLTEDVFFKVFADIRNFVDGG